jgi:membrane-associated PAP2 superfamily phosphatase
MFRSDCGTWPPHSHFWLRVGVLLPVGLAACALLFRYSGLDAALSSYFYDAAQHRFLVGTNGWIELLGHRVGKSVVLVCWMLLLAAAIAAPRIPGFARHRRLVWTLVLAMALGPVVVTLLKDINSHACPWSLKAYGGAAEYSATWFVSRVEAGRCFPGGHAAGGFSIVAVAFAGAVLRRPRLCRAGLWLGLGVGAAFSILQVAKGAHFMSHNLWAAAIDLWMAALVFSPLMAPGRASPSYTNSVSAEGQQ